MWRDIVRKTDLEKNPKRFWKDDGRIIDGSKGKWMETYKD